MPRDAEILTELGAVAAVLADAGPPDRVFSVIEAALQRLLGHRMFTFLLFHPASNEMERLHSSQQARYPAAGRKPMRGGPWREAVIERGTVFMAEDAAAIRATFSDHQLLAELGCESAMNVPVRCGGETLGTMNLLDAAGRYDATAAQTARLFASFAAAPFLLHRRESGR